MSVKAAPATLHLLQLPRFPSAVSLDARQPSTTPTVALASITTTTAISSKLASSSICAA